MHNFKILAWTVVCVFYGLAKVKSLELNVAYKEVPALRGTMCLRPDVAFNSTAVANDLACVRMCILHTSCQSIFYDVSGMVCVGCARRYYNASEADASGNTVHYAVSSGRCNVLWQLPALIASRRSTSKLVISQEIIVNIRICDIYLVSGHYGIPDKMITVSSHHVDSNDPELFGPKYSRLNSVYTVPGSAAWSANTPAPTEYIQAEFYNVKLLTGVSTQGRPDNSWSHQYVTAYEVHYSLDCSTFIPASHSVKIFPGNTDRETIVTNSLSEPVYARCVRIYAVAHNNWVSTRFDLIGCI